MTRQNFEMTEEDLQIILDACKPTPVLYISGGYNIGGDPQENANAAWKKLGEKMGFDYLTVQPTAGGGSNRLFSAVSTETEEQRAERLESEAKQKKHDEIQELKNKITTLREKLAKLTN